MIHSYTSLKAFEDCPRHFYARFIEKSIKFQTSPALEKGRAVHEALEREVRDGTPSGVWTPPGLMQRLRKGKAQAEVKLAVDRDWKPVSFWDKTAMLRGAIDVDLQVGSMGLMVDWKTGQIRPDEAQADTYAALKRTYGADEVTFYWVYVDQGATRATVPDRDAQRRVQEKIDRVEAAQAYPPIHHYACRWCPVLGCEYNRNE